MEQKGVTPSNEGEGLVMRVLAYYIFDERYKLGIITLSKDIPVLEVEKMRYYFLLNKAKSVIQNHPKISIIELMNGYDIPFYIANKMFDKEKEI